MRVAFYYNLAVRLPKDDPRNNPYGELLIEALERRGVQVEYTIQFDEAFLTANQGRIDVLHFHWPHFIYYDPDAAVMSQQVQTFVGRLQLARDLGYKVVWTAHNLYPHNRTHQDIDHECRLALCRLCTAILAHCDVAAAALRRTFGRSHSLFVAPHGHFIGVYPDRLTRVAARTQLGIPQDAFVYGLFGNLQPYKGVERLIDHIGRLPGHDSWLVVSGGNRSPAYLESLHEYAAGRPRIVLRTYPRAPSEDVDLVHKAADVITLPFADTMTSGTLILALSCSKPVIAPALGCLPSTVDPAAGILYPPDDPGALYRALLDIRRRDLAAASQAAFASARRLDWDAIAATTVQAYRA